MDITFTKNELRDYLNALGMTQDEFMELEVKKSEKNTVADKERKVKYISESLKRKWLSGERPITKANAQNIIFKLQKCYLSNMRTGEHQKEEMVLHEFWDKYSDFWQLNYNEAYKSDLPILLDLDAKTIYQLFMNHDIYSTIDIDSIQFLGRCWRLRDIGKKELLVYLHQIDVKLEDVLECLPVISQYSDFRNNGIQKTEESFESELKLSRKIILKNDYWNKLLSLFSDEEIYDAKFFCARLFFSPQNDILEWDLLIAYTLAKSSNSSVRINQIYQKLENIIEVQNSKE